MRVLVVLFWVPVALWLGACGSTPPKETTEPERTDTETLDTDEAEKKQAVENGTKQIRRWLSEDLSAKLKTSGKIHGKTLAKKIMENGEVMAKAKTLSSSVLKDELVKPKLDKVEDKATAGFGKKLTLGWKALKAGGIGEFKKKVSADATRVGIDVLNIHVKQGLMKDERADTLFKNVSLLLKVQGRLAAIALQENLSPKVTQKILSIALRLSAAGSNAKMAERVHAWISTCEADANEKIDRLLGDVVQLQSATTALSGLAFEVLEHPRTKNELATMVNTLLDDDTVNDGLTKVYEAAAFEKGDAAIQTAMESVLQLDMVDTAIFDTLTRLAAAEGAGDIIGKHLQVIGEDPKLAVIIEEFILSILDTCGTLAGA